MVARKAKESSIKLIYFSCRGSVVVVIWTKDDIVRINL
jgi:hypothetical protein